MNINLFPQSSIIEVVNAVISENKPQNFDHALIKNEPLCAHLNDNADIAVLSII